MQAAKNWCDKERVKKLGIWRWSKQGHGASVEFPKSHQWLIVSEASTQSIIEESDLFRCLVVNDADDSELAVKLWTKGRRPLYFNFSSRIV